MRLSEIEEAAPLITSYLACVSLSSFSAVSPPFPDRLPHRRHCRKSCCSSSQNEPLKNSPCPVSYGVGVLTDIPIRFIGYHGKLSGSFCSYARWLRFRPVIISISEGESSKSKMRMFSSVYASLSQRGMVTSLRCMCQRRMTCAADLLCRAAISPIAGSSNTPVTPCLNGPHAST